MSAPESVRLSVVHSVPLVRSPHVRFESFGCCIYCGKSPPEAELTDEHIIPDGIGGNLVLTEGSCRGCARALHRFESAVINRHFGLARYALGIKSKKRRGKSKKGHPGTYKLTSREGEPLEVPTGPSMPQVIFAGHFNQPASLLTGVDQSNGKAAFSLGIRNVTAPKGQRYGPSVRPPGPVRVDYFTRFVAKVAHSYAVAALGYGTFIPFLPRYIDGSDDSLGVKLIGIRPSDVILEGSLHRVAASVEDRAVYPLPMLPPSNRRLVLVYLDLFLGYDLPTYEVVVGEVPMARHADAFLPS